MTAGLSSISSVPLDGFAICNSRGRRVSLLNEEEDSFGGSSYTQPPSPQQYPSPARTVCSSESVEHSLISPSYYNIYPPTSIPAISPRLPPLTDLISFPVPKYDPENMSARKSSFSTASDYSHRGSVASISSRRGSAQSNQSKGNKRRYECATCGKTFTTSGHVARHNRIHTGEKNFQCPETGCSQRFSRQDNCMQHYRTHKNHAAARNEAPHSPRLTPPLESSPRNKRRRMKEAEIAETSVDPNDRLSAFANYISAYA